MANEVACNVGIFVCFIFSKWDFVVFEVVDDFFFRGVEEWSE